jgi:hypothetical protein
MPTTLEKRRTYRRRTARSLCRKRDGKKCLRVKGCKQTKKTMKRKSYCRKSKKHVVKGGDDPETTVEVKYETTIKDKNGKMYLNGAGNVRDYLKKWIGTISGIMAKRVYMYDETKDRANREMQELKLTSVTGTEDEYSIKFIIKPLSSNYYIHFYPKNNNYVIIDPDFKPNQNLKLAIDQFLQI